MNIQTLFGLTTLSILLTACGGSSDSASNNLPLNPNDNNTTPTNPTLNCKNGIPSNLTVQGSGLLNTPMYNIIVEQIAGKNYAIISSHQIINGTWYAKTEYLLNHTYKPTFVNAGNDYALTPTQLFSSKTRAETNYGLPYGYLLSQQDLNAVLVPFNDRCDTSNQVKVTYAKIDISGKKLSDVLLDNSTALGLTIKLNSDLNYYLSKDATALNKIKASNAVFPQGAFLIYPEHEIYETPNIYFTTADEYIENYPSLEDRAKNYPIKSDYQWKKDIFAGYNVIYSVNSSDGKPVYSSGIDPAVEYNGKIYDGEWNIGDTYANHPDNYNYGQRYEIYFNQTAIQAIAAELNRSVYPTS